MEEMGVSFRGSIEQTSMILKEGEDDGFCVIIFYRVEENES
jgi:hypothetical protein